MPSVRLTTLIHETAANPIFGDTFSGTELRNPLWVAQLNEIEAIAQADLEVTLTEAIPGIPPAKIHQLGRQIIPKAIAFCPALTAGELPGQTNRLAKLGGAIIKMYLMDQTADRGDEQAVIAVNEWQGLGSPVHDDPVIARYQTIMRRMEEDIAQFTRPEDFELVRDCFTEQVLRREMQIRRLSEDYKLLPADRQQAFLTEHSQEIATLMTITAGFPSVSSGLYAVYRQGQDQLPPLSAIYASPEMKQLLQVCNVAARIADERSDYRTDAGLAGSAWGVFTLNPFNQYCPAIIQSFCDQAGMTDQAQIDEVQQAFAHFSEDPDRYGEQITQQFFNQAKAYLQSLEQKSELSGYSTYLTLCKRVLEICHVNMQGDIKLAEQP